MNNFETYLIEMGYVPVRYDHKTGKREICKRPEYSTLGTVSVTYYPAEIAEKIASGEVAPSHGDEGIVYGLGEVGRGPELLYPIPFILRQIKDNGELKRIYEVSGGSVMPKDVDRGMVQHGCEAVYNAIINNKLLVIEPEPEMSWQ